MQESRPTVLSIAGYDPSSGAGVTADIKTIAAHGCYGVTCITALTVQSTQGVRRVQAVPGRLIAETLEELAGDIGVVAVRIGMLASGEVAEAVVEFLSGAGLRNVVLDPVLRSSSGTDLLDERGIEVLRTRLIQLADVVTPNMEEAAALSGVKVESLFGMKKAAAKLHEMGARAVVITGGHLREPVDLLSVGRKQIEFAGKRIKSNATHGTGCAFATALACNLARGIDLKDSVRAAGQYVRRAIARAYPVGRGKGPINHLYGMREA
jgi:hydroxymethylpyrimidine/phosphomethylpyrimidine kinase